MTAASPDRLAMPVCVGAAGDGLGNVVRRHHRRRVFEVLRAGELSAQLSL
jgi:hypothetical protein